MTKLERYEIWEGPGAGPGQRGWVDANEAQKLVDCLEAERDSLRKQLNEMNDLREETRVGYERLLKERSAEAETWKKRWEAAETRREHAVSYQKELLETIRSLRARRRVLPTKMDALEDKVDKLETANTVLRGNSDDLRKQLTNAKKDRDSLLVEKKELLAGNHRLRAKLKDYRAKIRRLEEDGDYPSRSRFEKRIMTEARIEDLTKACEAKDNRVSHMGYAFEEIQRRINHAREVIDTIHPKGFDFLEAIVSSVREDEDAG